MLLFKLVPIWLLLCLGGIATLPFSSTMAVVAFVALVLSPSSAVPFSFTLFIRFLGVIFGSLAQFLRKGELVNFSSDELFNGCEAGLVVDGYEGDGATLGSSTGGTSDAVYIVLAVARSIVVDDKAYVVDVDAT